MASAPSTKKLSIAGPAGELEALIDLPRDAEPVALAVACHPHPQHGGTMHNKVVHTLSRTYARLGLKARFRHYVNLRRTETRLRRLFVDLNWKRIDEVFLSDNQSYPEIDLVSGLAPTQRSPDCHVERA